MAEDLQYLMERIQKDAVDKAETEAAAIIARAKDKAAEIVKAAEAEASAKLEKADKDAEAFTERRRTPKRLRNAANALWNSLPATSCFR